MPLSLPDRPCLEFLRKQAKDLLRSHQKGEHDACPMLRRLHRFSRTTDAEILAAPIALHEVQFALALEYGLGSWHALKAHVEANGSKSPNHRTNLAALKIAGHINMEDSFSHVLATAANLLGIATDYETVFALSTNAFTPALDPAEDCAAWWHMYGRNIAADAAAMALGLAVQPVRLPDIDLRYNTPKDQAETLQAEQRRLCSQILREAMADNVVVITDGGWEIRGPHGYTPWCWWGIITQAMDDKPVLGATLNSHADNPLHHLEGCWTVRKVGQLRTADAGVNVLRQAVERIAGRAPFAGLRVQYGLPAMDLWIDKMRTVPGFCQPCTAKAYRGGACAMTNARAMHRAASHAGHFLRRELPDWPEESQPHLENAAQRYDRMAGLLQPLTTMEQGQGYHTIVGDLDRQRAHARDVLEPVMKEMAGAGEDIRRALDIVE